MMKTVVRVLIFILAFQMEVKVRASSAAHHDEGHDKASAGEHSAETVGHADDKIAGHKDNKHAGGEKSAKNKKHQNRKIASHHEADDHLESSEYAVKDNKYVQEPEECLKDSVKQCSIYVISPTFDLNTEQIKLHAKQTSTLIRQDIASWRFVRGTLWVEKANFIDFDTLYGRVLARSGQFWLIDQDHKIIVRNINAELELTLADGKKLEIPPGFELWISGINSKGHNEFGMIEPISMKEHMASWAFLYKGSANSFVEEAKKMNRLWGNLVERSTHIYREEIDRKVAQAEENIRQKQTQKLQIDEKRKKAQKLLFERTFER